MTDTLLVPVADVVVGDVIIGQGRWRAKVEAIERPDGMYLFRCAPGANGANVVGPMTSFYNVQVEREAEDDAPKTVRVVRAAVTLDETESPETIHDIARILLECADRPLNPEEFSVVAVDPEPSGAEVCDECGREIPGVNGGGLANRHHAESCSLYDGAGA